MSGDLVNGTPDTTASARSRVALLVTVALNVPRESTLITNPTRTESPLPVVNLVLAANTSSQTDLVVLIVKLVHIQTSRRPIVLLVLLVKLQIQVRHVKSVLLVNFRRRHRLTWTRRADPLQHVLVVPLVNFHQHRVRAVVLIVKEVNILPSAGRRFVLIAQMVNFRRIGDSLNV